MKDLFNTVRLLWHFDISTWQIHEAESAWKIHDSEQE